MSRNDKIGAFVLGALLFSGLFYFIYTTMRNPLPTDLGDDGLTAGDTLTDEETLNQGDEETATADEETPAVSTTTAAPAAK
jgi:hypothetical protein